MAELGVNIDHVATVREARKSNEPDPVWAAALAELGGADGITLHLREDRRHIQDRDLRVMKETVRCKLNLELACDNDVFAIALQVRPEQATLVPEKREELTTEGGLDVVGQREKVKSAIQRLKDAGIIVSLFLDPDQAQINAAAEIGADAIELHTGTFSLTRGQEQQAELAKIEIAGKQILDLGMVLHAGHGLDYLNVKSIARIPGMCELNIGHSIIARSIMIGMREAVHEMKQLIVGSSS